MRAQDQPKEPRAHKKRISIALVDDHEFLLECLGKLLRYERDTFRVVGEFRTAEAAIAGCQRVRADVVLLDINLPGKSGLDAVPELKLASPDTRILLCTAFPSDGRILAALTSGAHGFVEKTGHWSELVEAIRQVAAGHYYLCPRSTAALAYYSQQRPSGAAPGCLTCLTDRERDVVRLVANGKSSKEIADELSISAGTVDVHRSHAMKKLGVTNMAALIVSVFQLGLAD